MAQSGDDLLSDQSLTANVTVGALGQTGVHAVGSDSGISHGGVAQSSLLLVGGVIATAASLVCIPTDLGTGGSLGGVLDLVVAQSLDGTGLGGITNRAGSLLGTGSGTGGSLGLGPCAPGVTLGGDDGLAGGVITAGALALLVSGITVSGTGGILACHRLHVVTQRRHVVGEGVTLAAATAGKLDGTGLGTSGLGDGAGTGQEVQGIAHIVVLVVQVSLAQNAAHLSGDLAKAFPRSGIAGVVDLVCLGEGSIAQSL